MTREEMNCSALHAGYYIEFLLARCRRKAPIFIAIDGFEFYSLDGAAT